MTDANAGHFAARLTLLAEVFNEPMTPTRIAGYRAALNDLVFDDLAAALNDCAKTCTFFPKPAEIRERVKVARQLRMERERALWLRMRETEADAALEAHQHAHAQALLEAPDPPAPYDERLATQKAILAKLKTLVRPTLALPVARTEQADRVRTQIEQWRRESES